MKEIGLFYAMNAAKTSHIAEKIREICILSASDLCI